MGAAPHEENEMNANEVNTCPCGPNCACSPCQCNENEAPEADDAACCGAGCSCEG